MKIEIIPGGTPPPPICKLVVTLSDIDPFCCVQTLTSGWADGFPDANNQIVLQTLNPAKALTLANPVSYRVCGRNTDGFVSVCLQAFTCNGLEYCTVCSDPVPASQTCYFWTPSSVKNNEQFNEAVTLKAPYPNPSNQTTTLSYTQKIDGVMEVSIFDPQGKLVKTIEQKGFSGNSYSVDVYVSELTEGAYFAKLNFNGFTREVKFIVKH